MDWLDQVLRDNHWLRTVLGGFVMALLVSFFRREGRRARYASWGFKAGQSIRYALRSLRPGGHEGV